jgi:hypothetical protein
MMHQLKFLIALAVTLTVLIVVARWLEASSYTSMPTQGESGPNFATEIDKRFDGTLPISPQFITLHYSQLPAPNAPKIIYLDDGKAQPGGACAGGGGGAWGFVINGAWICFDPPIFPVSTPTPFVHIQAQQSHLTVLASAGTARNFSVLTGPQVLASAVATSTPTPDVSAQISAREAPHVTTLAAAHVSASVRAPVSAHISISALASTTPTPTPTSEPTPDGTVSGLSGSCAGIANSDCNNTANYGHYNATGGSRDGYNLIGGPLLDDVTAATFVVKTQKSSVETGATGAANTAANDYFHCVATSSTNNATCVSGTNYKAAITLFQSDYSATNWFPEIQRVDGGCSMITPTTAEVLQWAANKWGINPILLYAEANNEGDWDQTAIGDNGRSSGILQVADRGANHAWPGFEYTSTQNLARESTCFNADFFAAHLWSAFNHGTAPPLTGECSGVTLDIGGAIQSWFDGSATCGDGAQYLADFDSALNSKIWESRFFGGNPVPY